MLSKKPLSVHGKFGLERENLRINADGTLALTPHPQAFGNKHTNSEITTDFSESQLELVTPVASSIHEMLAHEKRLTKVIYSGIKPELLWPLSSPPDQLPPDDQIPIADFGLEGKEKTDYRIYLSKKYGRTKQLYCGIHFNFSVEKSGLISNKERNLFYLNLVANASRYRYFLMYLLSASPKVVQGIHYRSVRLSSHGYQNTVPVYPDYSSPEAYIASLQTYVNQGVIESPRELYQLVRIKGKGYEDLTHAPEASRVELRISDLNPLFDEGINPNDLYLMHLYLLWCAQNEHSVFTLEKQKEATLLSNEATMLYVSPSFSKRMDEMFHALQSFLKQQTFPACYTQALDEALLRWRNPSKGYAEQIRRQLETDPNVAMKWAVRMKHAHENSSHFTY
ncbi:glutathione synthase [Sporolactobacillus kofuensis]|uniref:Glutamate--cysteine ligase n=1 Tax=Sporolactobacillus kofuensis TaxID=269672 RepID=A0ABW1WEM3_9BACL|nr:glutathione synthase [Sporolactobacillus kofuensis]MCO7176294.1 glutathione synthase [Sporolactobacillus kofuensis]